MSETQNIKGYKHTALGLMPKEWEVKELGKCCDINGEYGINAAAVEYSEVFPTYLRITDIDDDGNFLSVDKKSVDDKNYKRCILKDGDIVFARTGATVGKTYLYKKSDGELVFAGFLIKFHPKENILLPCFLKSFTETKPYWDWVKKTSARSGQPGINGVEYSGLKLPLPSLPEQTAIANLLNTWDTAIQKTASLITQKDLRKKWLMQQLLTGKKRLKGFSGEWKEYRIAELFEKVSRYKDFLISKRQVSHGSWGIVTSEFHDRKVSDEYDCLIVKDNKKLHIEFWDWFCKMPLMQHYAYLASNGVHIEKLIFDFDSFKRRRVIIPPSPEEQATIAKVLQAADKAIQLLKSKLEKLKEQKKGLIQVLLTGKKRLKIDN